MADHDVFVQADRNIGLEAKASDYVCVFVEAGQTPYITDSRCYLCAWIRELVDLTFNPAI